MSSSTVTATTFEDLYEDPHLPMIIQSTHYPMHTGGYCMNWHENMEIIYILDGRCTILSNSTHFTVSKGDAVIINSNEIHMVYTDDFTCDYLYLIPGLKLSDSLTLNVQTVQFSSKPNDPYIGNTILGIYSEYTEKKPLYKANMTSQLMNLLVYLYRNHKVAEFQTEDSATTRLEKQKVLKIALKYLQNHCTENITLEDLCYKLGFNKYYFCHLFKELTNQTVFHYINNLRCERARALLYTGRYTIAEVSELCGFCSASYFTKQYKKYMKCLPSVSLRDKPEIKPPSRTFPLSENQFI